MRLMSMPSLYGSKGGHVYHPSPIPVKEFLEATVELTADQPLHIVASRSAVPSSSSEGYRLGVRGRAGQASRVVVLLHILGLALKSGVRESGG